MGDWDQCAVLLSQVILAGVVQMSAFSLELGWRGECQDGIAQMVKNLPANAEPCV